MQNYLKLPLTDYNEIRAVLDQLLLETKGDTYHKVLNIGNILFESTHNFDSGEPYLHSDEETLKE